MGLLLKLDALISLQGLQRAGWVGPPGGSHLLVAIDAAAADMSFISYDFGLFFFGCPMRHAGS